MGRGYGVDCDWLWVHHTRADRRGGPVGDPVELVVQVPIPPYPIDDHVDDRPVVILVCLRFRFGSGTANRRRWMLRRVWVNDCRQRPGGRDARIRFGGRRTGRPRNHRQQGGPQAPFQARRYGGALGSALRSRDQWCSSLSCPDCGGAWPAAAATGACAAGGGPPGGRPPPGGGPPGGRPPNPPPGGGPLGGRPAKPPPGGGAPGGWPPGLPPQAWKPAPPGKR